MSTRSIEELVSARSLKAAYAAMRSNSRVTIDLSPLRAPLARELKARAREQLGTLTKAQIRTVDKSVALELQRIQANVIGKIRDDILESRKSSVSEGRDIVKEALTKAGVYGPKPFVLNTLLTTFSTILTSENTQQIAGGDDGIWGFTYQKNTERHAALHNTTLPKDDPFWDTYTPPNGYGCKCTLKIVRTPALSFKPTGLGGLVDKEFQFKPRFLHLD